MSKIIAHNKKVYRDYNVLEKIECGIELKGGEVKSVRDGKTKIEDSFAIVEENELILYNMYISAYAEASYLNVASTRTRKLLAHRNQINRLEAQVDQRGLTLVPTQVYINDRGLVKIELALCKGKKIYDKREDIKRREVDLSLRRTLKHRRR